ncbi:MAG: ZIP family metal transporter [Erysipelotrichales bacterium]|nr:ZIP family metal transporter [Erysipelotrichales bacterium]
MFYEVIIISVIAGVVGMGLGGIICSFLKKGSDASASIMLAFAGGLMISIVFFDLLPEAVEYSNNVVATISIVGGMALIFFLNLIVDRITENLLEKKTNKTHVSLEELTHGELLIEAESGKSKKTTFFKAAFLMIVAIALHNFPEGMAIGSVSANEITSGIMLAVVIGLHTIPEGMAVAAPLISGGMRKTKVILITFLAGTPLVFGAALGFFLGGISDYVLAICLAGAGGAMLYVVFGEIIPQSLLLRKGKLPAVVTLIGIIVGYIFVSLLH